MCTPIENIRLVADLCRAGEPLPENVAGWLGRSLEAYLDRQAVNLNDAFGVRNARGGVDWRHAACIARRDVALRAMADEHLSGLGVSAKAQTIHRLANRYASSAWLHDRESEGMPKHYEGKPAKWLWTAFQSGAPMPLCVRRLRTILAD
jgi:hypothetical protein